MFDTPSSHIFSRLPEEVFRVFRPFRRFRDSNGERQSTQSGPLSKSLPYEGRDFRDPGVQLLGERGD